MIIILIFSYCWPKKLLIFFESDITISQAELFAQTLVIYFLHCRVQKGSRPRKTIQKFTSNLSDTIVEKEVTSKTYLYAYL